jgi:hypothetical protein
MIEGGDVEREERENGRQKRGAAGLKDGWLEDRRGRIEIKTQRRKENLLSSIFPILIGNASPFCLPPTRL